MIVKFTIEHKESDLKDIPLSSTVAILIGTFDPIHRGHIEVAQQALKQNLGDSGVDLVLFHLHSNSRKKMPSPYQDRLEILKGYLFDQTQLGMLDPVINELIENIVKGNLYSHPISWVSVLFQLLSSYHPISYARILGSDRIAKAVEEQLNIRHYVSPRDMADIALPANFIVLPKPKMHLSSTSYRNGSQPFGSEYWRVTKILRKIYPNAKFST